MSTAPWRHSLLASTAVVAMVGAALTTTAHATNAGTTTDDAAASAAHDVAQDQVKRASPALMVVGDSISTVGSWYDRDVAGDNPVWWSYVSRAAGLDPADPTQVAVDARPQTAFGVTRCEPGIVPFADRLEAVRRARPAVLVVAGGRNETTACRGGERVPSWASESNERIARYFADLAAVADQIGLARDDVFVVVPWGSSGQVERERVTRQVRTAAAGQGFSYVATTPMTRSQTSDGTHPTAAGSASLGRQVMHAEALMRRLGMVGPIEPPPPAPADSAADTMASTRGADPSWTAPAAG